MNASRERFVAKAKEGTEERQRGGRSDGCKGVQ
jgi:hypothetical protein